MSYTVEKNDLMSQNVRLVEQFRQINLQFRTLINQICLYISIYPDREIDNRYK